MAAPQGTVWLVEQKRYRTEEEHTTGPVPENLWQFGVQVQVRCTSAPSCSSSFSMHADDDALHVWQARVKSKVSKPRNMPYPSEGLTFQGGEGAVVVDMLNEKLVWSLSSSSLPGPTKIVYGQLQHGRSGDNAWMRSLEDVKAAFIDAYAAGKLEEYTKDMTTTTFCLPWPPVTEHLVNLAVDMGACLLPCALLMHLALLRGCVWARARACGRAAPPCMPLPTVAVVVTRVANLAVGQGPHE